MKKSLAFVLALFLPVLLRADSFAIDDSKSLGFFKMGKGSRNVVLVPGIGDLKENYLDFAREISDEATIYGLDLRGTGESSTDFEAYGADSTGKDLIAFIESKDLKKVTIIGNSMSCASAVYAAVRLPDRIEAIILTGPFLRDTDLGFFMKTTMRVLFAGPWGPSAFKSFYKGLYPVNIPKDLEEHSDKIKANLGEDGRMFAVRSMFFTRKPESAKSIETLNTKVVIIMGSKEPDFKDPTLEAKDLANLTKGEYFMFENAGHYPYKEDPKKLKEILLSTWLKK